MPALQMAGIRQLIAGACYAGFFLARGMRLPRGREWIPVLVLSLLNFVLSNGLSTWGVKFISAGLGAIIGAIFPLWIVLIGLFGSREKIPARAIAGLLLGFAGICVIFYPHLRDFLDPDFMLGIVLSIAATWTWAFGTIYTKQQAANFNPYFSLGLQMLISGFILTLVTQLLNRPGLTTAISLTEIHWRSWLAIGYLVVFGSMIAFVSYLYALQHLPTGQASIYAYMNPVVAVVCGWLIFGEQLTGFIIVGGAVTLLGVYLVNRAFRAVPAPEQPEPEGV